ncbi:MAG: PAP2 family protein [Gammaproteobacteria bacterium]|nr:MAG: PAP2 family protein [Gammaproteobacteria bacterium]
MAINNSVFLRQHLLYPVLFLMAASFAIIHFNIDMRLEDYFYALQGHSWAWKNSWVAEALLHKGGRELSIFLGAIVICALCLSLFLKSQSHIRKPLAYLFLAVAGASPLVGLLKASLDISCPWEFGRYGGALSYVDVIQQLHLRNGEGCFPAAHASAGYSWVALYFFGLFFQSRLRWLGLAGALGCGILFGFTQQIRGAHFLSHDLWSLAVCWFYSLSVYLVFSHSYVKNHIRIRMPVNA